MIPPQIGLFLAKDLHIVVHTFHCCATIHMDLLVATIGFFGTVAALQTLYGTQPYWLSSIPIEASWSG
jgi:hypothetical protein